MHVRRPNLEDLASREKKVIDEGERARRGHVTGEELRASFAFALFVRRIAGRVVLATKIYVSLLSSEDTSRSAEHSASLRGVVFSTGARLVREQSVPLSMPTSERRVRDRSWSFAAELTNRTRNDNREQKNNDGRSYPASMNNLKLNQREISWRQGGSKIEEG